MVTEVVEAPVETDQVPAEETAQTEIPETPAEEVGDAAESAEEAAVEEPEQLVPVPEERRYTQAEVDAERQRVAAEALAWDQRRRQSEEGQKAAAKARREQEAAAMTETVEVALNRAGITPDEDVVRAVVERVNSKRVDFAMDKAISDLDTAVQYVTAPIRGDFRTAEELGISPVHQAFAQKIQPELQKAYEAGMKVVADAWGQEMIPRSQLPQLVDAEIQKRNAKSREGKKPLVHIDGSTTTNTNTIESWEARIAHQGETGYPMLEPADWAEYRQIRRANGL